MLTNLYLENFKCFQSLSLELKPLTILSGVNGGGKSTVIQSLVLMAQNFKSSEWGRSLLLEGPELSLGSALDVLNQRASRNVMMIGASTTAQKVQWRFGVEDRRALALSLNAVEVDDVDVEIALPLPLRWLMPERQSASSSVVSALASLSWITAERIGPRELLPLRDHNRHSTVGSRGELAAGLYYWCESDDVDKSFLISKVPAKFGHQVRAWMRNFFPDCDLRVSPISGASAVTLQMRSDESSDFQRPQNVGFGLTQVFPILVAIFMAQRGQMLLIENPEVHLHPKAQQDLGFLLANVAADGVQVILETHSDHVLNGVRLAIKEKVLAHERACVHFFSPKNKPTNPISPTFDVDGRLNTWPNGFFDQFDNALSRLM